MTDSDHGTAGVQAGTPGPARAALMMRGLLLAAGETLDEAWPALIAKAVQYTGAPVPRIGHAEFAVWLASALGVPPGQLPGELDELLPGTAGCATAGGQR
jgi:hypothetical protein